MSETFVQRLARRASSAESRLENIKESANEVASRTFMLAEVAIGAGGFAYANARFGKGAGADSEIAFAGIPADIAAGAALGGLALFGAFGKKYDEHVFNLGAGCVTAFITRKAMGMGLAAAGQAATSTTAHTAGAMGPGNGNPYASWYSGQRQGAGRRVG